MYIQDIFPNTNIYKTMKVWSLPKGKKHMLEDLCNSGDYFAQIKQDGNSYQLIKNNDGKVMIFSRGITVSTGLPKEQGASVPHLIEAFKGLPNDTVIIGELYYPKTNSDSVRRIMGCNAPRAIERQKSDEFGGWIRFYPFDLLRVDGVDICNLGALERYEKLVKLLSDCNIDITYIDIPKIITENIYQFILDNFNNGEEGTVLKKKDYPYVEDSSPSWSMIKVKKSDSIDLVCMGFNDPEKEYVGKDLLNWSLWENNKTKEKVAHRPNKEDIDKFTPITKDYFLGVKNGLKCGLYKDDELIFISDISSGLTDEIKMEMTKFPEAFLNATVECACMEITRDCSIRHPVFIKFREDKPSIQCQFSDYF